MQNNLKQNIMITYIFGILGLLAIVIAVSSSRAASRADREIEKIINKDKEVKQ